MTTYTAIDNANIDQDSPVTQPLLTLMRDNPIAITEGALNAPKVVSAALNMTFLDGAGVYTDLDRIDNLLIFASARSASTSSGAKTVTVRYRLSSDNGSTFGSYVTVVTATTNGAGQPPDDLTRFRLVSLGANNAIELNVSAATDTSGVIQALAISGVTP